MIRFEFEEGHIVKCTNDGRFKVKALKLIKLQYNLLQRYTALMQRVYNNEINQSIIMEAKDLIEETRSLNNENS